MANQKPSRRAFLGHSITLASTLTLTGCLNGNSGTDDDGDSQTTTTMKTTATTTDSNESSPQTVSFGAPHGTTIEATAYGSGDCGVVLVPQINMDRESWRGQGELIAKMGHLALAIDEDPDNRSASVRGAIQYLREQQVSTIILIGASSGGEAVVVANATTDATVDGMITLSAGGGADHAAQLQGRLLFVVSKGDDDRFVRVARQLHQGASEPKELVEYDGSAHGQRIFDSDHGADLQKRIRSFITDVCSN